MICILNDRDVSLLANLRRHVQAFPFNQMWEVGRQGLSISQLVNLVLDRLSHQASIVKALSPEPGKS